MTTPKQFPKALFGPDEICTPMLDLSDLFDEVYNSPNKDHMQNLHLWEVDIPTTPIRAHKPFGVSYSELRVLDFIYAKKASRASL
jgi:hypothetical protein